MATPTPEPSANSGPQQCFECNSKTQPLYICVICNNLLFCDGCWPVWVLHGTGAAGNGAKPHEKMNPRVVERVKKILEPELTELEHEKDLSLEEDTTWFGVTRDEANQPVFQDYGRFATLMTEGQSIKSGQKYPQLVSFIGETGAGKSTIVKMLIDRQLDAITDPESRKRFPSPVTSSNNDRLPTTGDVHLYADPYSYLTRAPVLYADCEGLNGGEALPKGLRNRGREYQYLPESLPLHQARGSSRSRVKLRRNRHSSQRDIMWATTPERQKREYAVTQLYPRLLYTFSDVVVFVLRNPRSFESTVLQKLLEWGAASIDKSLNQPALPHAIILLNATENVDEKEWEVETSTNLLMTDIQDAIRREPMIEELARQWRLSGRRIQTTSDLLHCYYASVTCIRVPRGRYMLMDQQVGKLSNIITKKCEKSLLIKKRVRMLSNSEKLQLYLQAAYDHFSKDLDTPFDFVKEALKHNPIPRDFGGNILNLAISIMKNCDTVDKVEGAQYVFNKMAPMIASCILLDSVRQNLLGTTVQLLQDAYVFFCQAAIQDFALMYWPCTYRSKSGKCCNVKSGHRPKGHQNELGKVIGSGNYESNFDPDYFFPDWIKLIESNLERLQTVFNTTSIQLKEQSEEFTAWNLHLAQLQDFYTGQFDVDASSFLSNLTCFCCLRELPEYPLPYGHVLTSVELSNCPLHKREVSWSPPWEVPVKPKYAGVRVLSLDGGGARGIASLQVLKGIERVLGPKLPLQAFFDLIVGTSTGGIISLGLGVMNWDIDECIWRFKSLVGKAFTCRELAGIPLLEQLAVMKHGSIYKTRPFEEALHSAFGSEMPLFGGVNNRGEMMTKVAITSTSELEQNPVVMANYNRPECLDYDIPYKFLRTPGPDTEMKVWEAARASSAAPPFFKAFQKHATGATYIDGALYHNCPVVVSHHERKLIWGDVTGSPPDLLLSVGTGKFGPGQPRTTYRDRVMVAPPHVASPTSPPPQPKPATSFFIPKMAKIAFDRFDNLLRSEKIWSAYLSNTAESSHHNTEPGIDRRFIRLNPELGFKVPKMDDVDSIPAIEDAVEHDVLRFKEKYVEVAHRLIASTFFFQKDSSSVQPNGSGFRCTGTIYCRFKNNSDYVKALGDFLLGCLKSDFDPFFVIEEVGHPESAVRVTIKKVEIEAMAIRGDFRAKKFKVDASSELSMTSMSLCLRQNPYQSLLDSRLPISGFPRRLMSEDHQDQDISARRKLLNRHSGEYPGGGGRFQTIRRGNNNSGSSSGSGGTRARDDNELPTGSIAEGSRLGPGTRENGIGSFDPQQQRHFLLPSLTLRRTSGALQRTDSHPDRLARSPSAPSQMSLMSVSMSEQSLFTPSDYGTTMEEINGRRSSFICELEAPLS
ncbi:putative patatin-like serine protein [Zalerion maritima]|uniref:Patatin-like serine protein n=1 Tax=Zalerion maritima TaxID=339359 RepID=A0AAD5RVB4_9PEZI|nr:putative patatin-like serine protein [Zalerion maritima]